MAIQLFFVLVLLMPRTRAQLFVNISPQETYNAPLNPELVVRFNCNATTANIEWRVNNTIPSLGSELANKGVITSAVRMIDLGKFSSSLFIPARGGNGNTTVMCKAIDSNLRKVKDSSMVLFNIQGLLDAPPNLTLSVANNGGLTRSLSWDAPETLDITNVDPDIQSYRVCYNFTEEDSTCVSSERREFTFLNVRKPLSFTVTAFNVVGEGTASSNVHQSSACDNTAVINVATNKVRTSVSLTQSGTNPVVDFMFNKSWVTCFDVYEVHTKLLETTTSHGAQIPQLSSLSDSSVQLSLTVDSDLKLNEKYSAFITTVDDGKMNSTDTIEFSTYDVQAVNHTMTANGTNLLSCTFAEGSLARSCTLLICNETGIIISRSCENVTINRGSEHALDQPGLYGITVIAEIEEDGETTTLTTMDALQKVITIPTSVITSAPPASKAIDIQSYSDLKATIGGITGGIILLIMTAGAIVITSIMLILWTKTKMVDTKRNCESNGDKEKNFQMTDPFKATPATNNNQPDNKLPSGQNSNEAPAAANKGNPLHVELEHNKGEQNIAPPDMI